MAQQYSFSKKLLELFKPEETQEAFAERIGLSRNTIASYLKEKDKIPDTKCLLKIGKACQVSTDWMLGLSDVQSPDANVRAAAEYTGLSQKTIETLHRKDFAGGFFDSEDEESSDIHRFIDVILSTPEGTDFLLNVVQYMTSNNSKLFLDDETEIPPDRISFDGGSIGGLVPITKEFMSSIMLDNIKRSLVNIKEKCYKGGDT